MLVGTEVGPFLIERELGGGAMGSVYRAVYRDTGQRVALKFIALGLLGNETARKRFEREANILKQLRHPNIVGLIGHGRHHKTPYIAMEYVDGVPLDRLLAKRGAVPWDEVVALGQQLCDALQHAHEKGIIHRDLKPSNVMILKDGTVKLTDFGIAKDTDVTALTGANNTVGTAAYMSPEQCKGERNLSAKSDLYSMGVMFYELLTGRKPFIAESPIDMFQAHVYGTFERPARLALDIPVWLDTLVCQLLEKKPEHRPYDAAMVDKVLGEVEEKVAAQRSAGVDAVSARSIDRSTSGDDDIDRAAARSLRSAVTKKKLRKKVIPVGQRRWVQALGLAVGLAVVVGVFVWATKPPSLDQLYAQATAALDAKDTDRALDAVGRFLSRSDSEADARTPAMRDIRERLMVEKRERQLLNRYYSRFNLRAEDDGQKLAFQALKSEDEGRPDAAAEVWRDLAGKFADAADADTASYGWLARKKLADLASLPIRERRLLDILSQEQALRPPDTRPELPAADRSCFEALRLERFGDLPAARDRWERAADAYKSELEARPWAVMAAEHFRVLQADAVNGRAEEKAFRIKLLEAQMAEAQATPADPTPPEKRKAMSLCRDIVALYGQDPDPQISSFARDARQLMQSRGW